MKKYTLKGGVIFMAKKGDVCGCPAWIVWLLALLGLWHVAGAFGVQTWGGFWSWVVLLLGLGVWSACNAGKKAKGCFAGWSLWFGVLLTLAGAWHVLADVAVLSNYGVSLLHVVVLLGALAVANK